MKLKGSLPCSQQPATFHYLEPDLSSSRLSFYFLHTNFNIIIPTRLRHQQWISL